MKNYFETLNDQTKQYFKMLSSDIPDFLEEYINTPEMQRQSKISTSCGTVYSNMFNGFWYSSLEHSVAVALIIWNFTKDKKQTLSGLFHDIATPVFKHCIDFMNGDYEKQESTEDLTIQIIKNSKNIMKLLGRDGIKVEEISDYHIYPIADNDIPKLSADRLEYTLSNGLGVIEKIWDFNEVKQIYENIEVQENEEGVEELGFKNKVIAEKFVHGMSKLSVIYRSNKTKYSMQFLADIIKKMAENKIITKNDLYTLSEKDVINKIQDCKDNKVSECFKTWKNAININESEEIVKNKYCVSVNSKKRYIVPLIKCENKFLRINEISQIARIDINKCLEFETKKYAYLDFNFDI